MQHKKVRKASSKGPASASAPDSGQQSTSTQEGKNRASIYLSLTMAFFSGSQFRHLLNYNLVSDNIQHHLTDTFSTNLSVWPRGF